MRRLAALILALCLVLPPVVFARDLQRRTMTLDDNGRVIDATINRNTQTQTAVLNSTNVVNFTTPDDTSMVIFSVAPQEASFWVRLDGTNASVPDSTHNSTTFTSSIPNPGSSKVAEGQTISITSDEECKVAVEYYD